MKELARIVARLASEISRDELRYLADKLAASNDESRLVDAARNALEPGADRGAKRKLLARLEKEPRPKRRELALALQAVLETNRLQDERREKLEIVWTGPETAPFPTRRTEQALCEVIDAAKERLFLVAFALFQADLVLESLAAATKRGVRVRILVDRSKGNFSNALEKLKEQLPSAERYALTDDKIRVHAKCAVADASLALVTSANLTKPAMETNVELGVLIRGGAAPKKIAELLESLIDRKVAQRA